jgi:hypothetical protein
MAKVIKNIMEDAGQFGWDVSNNAIDLGRNISRLGPDLDRFGQDITGVTARKEAAKAADLQAQAELDAAAAERHQKKLAENAAEFRKARNSQLAARLATGGRAGTLTAGTTGFSSGSGDLLGGGTSGSKTLLGR